MLLLYKSVIGRKDETEKGGDPNSYVPSAIGLALWTMDNVWHQLPLSFSLWDALITVTFIWVLKSHVWNPFSAYRLLKNQGLTVLPYIPLFGNTFQISRLLNEARSKNLWSPHDHNILPRIQPFYAQSILKYGKRFSFWLGPVPRLLITDPDSAKEILSSRCGKFKKSGTSVRFGQRIFGTGLVLAEGENWHQQRQLLNPAFFNEKLKLMLGDMNDCSLVLARSLVKEMRKMEKIEVEVNRAFMDVTAAILARTCFGSSFEKGKTVFENQKLLTEIVVRDLVWNLSIPGYRYFVPTPANLKCWKLERSIEKDLCCIVEERRREMNGINSSSLLGLDLLGLMLAPQNDPILADLTTQQIIDQCKTFFFAGHETTANLLTWTAMLLSLHPEWQERLREEVVQICGDGHGDQPIKPDHLNKLNKMGMVLNEALRLYPPVPELSSRVADTHLGNGHNNSKVGSLQIPPNSLLHISVAAIHRDKELWGEDANEFKPERFAEGALKACKHPQGFIPFSFGPRNCIGRSFAMMEVKVVLAILLQRFCMELSPNYCHAPTSRITTTPQHGMPIIMSRILFPHEK